MSASPPPRAYTQLGGQKTLADTISGQMKTCGMICLGLFVLISFGIQCCIYIVIAFRFVEGVMQIDITAYYFAAGVGSPTVVVQHGNNCNNRDNTVITAAFFLHSMGFNVIAPNLRNHGDSGQTGRITWGQEETFDTFGAWDYVVTDPEGKIGFAQRPEKTALMGFSMGGLISRVAFALEPRIPALVTDCAHWNARNVLEWSINQKYPGLGGVFLPSAWFWAEHMTGHDLDRLIPEKLFQREEDRRLLANIHATSDDTVPIEQSQDFIAYIKDTDFQVLREWYVKLYGDDCEIHSRLHLQYPEKY